jgi:hypothetical protein
MKKLIVTLVVIVFVFSTLAAAHGAELSEIRIDGLKKTNVTAIRNIIRFEEGDDIETDDIPQIRQRLLRSGLFINETIRVELLTGVGDEVTLSLQLTDRMSLIPVPFFSAGSSGMVGGLFLMDNNFLGTGDSLFLGGMLSEDSRFVGLNYMDKNIGGSTWNLGAGFNYSDGETSITTTDDKELFSYDSTVIGGSVFAVWNRRPWSMEVGGGVSTADYDFLDDRVTEFRPTFILGYNMLHFGSFMAEGFKAGLTWAPVLYSSELDPTSTLRGTLEVQKLFTPRIRLGLGVHTLNYWGGEDLLSPSVRSSILPATVQADSFYSAQAEMQFVIADFRWGYLGLPIAYEAGTVDGISSNDEFFHGPSAALNLNLKKVAMPALSVRYGYNLETEEGIFGFSLGFSH